MIDPSQLQDALTQAKEIVNRGLTPKESTVGIAQNAESAFFVSATATPSLPSPNLPAIYNTPRKKKRSWQAKLADVKECGSKFFTLACKACGTLYASRLTCKHRLCPSCARARAMRFAFRLKKVIFKLFRYPLFLTLTLKVSPDLQGQISLMIKAFQKFRRHFKIKRGIAGIEFIKKPDGYYVHLHALLDCVWLKGEKVSAYWQKLTGSFVKDIKRVWRDKEKTCFEVSKYISKGILQLNENEKDFAEVDGAIKGRRLITCWGFSLKDFSLLETMETTLQKLVCQCGCPFFKWHGVYTEAQIYEKAEIFEIKLISETMKQRRIDATLVSQTF